MSHVQKSSKLPAYQAITLQDQRLTLLPQRAIYWEEKRYLLLADLHLGKAGHFRKNGLPIPAAVHWKDLVALGTLIETYQPNKVVFLGDLFHSALNNEWLDFEQWMQQYTPLPFVLVKGNHDILPEAAYALEQLSVKSEGWEVGPFLLTHQPRIEPSQGGGWSFPKFDDNLGSLYNLAGHIHPGTNVRLGLGQRTRVPCFFFGPGIGLLPAFGHFTGCVSMKIKPGDQVYAIIGDQSIVRFSTS